MWIELDLSLNLSKHSSLRLLCKLYFFCYLFSCATEQAFIVIIETHCCDVLSWITRDVFDFIIVSSLFEAKLFLQKDCLLYNISRHHGCTGQCSSSQSALCNSDVSRALPLWKSCSDINEGLLPKVDVRKQTHVVWSVTEKHTVFMRTSWICMYRHLNLLFSVQFWRFLSCFCYLCWFIMVVRIRYQCLLVSFSTLDVEFTAELKFTQRPSVCYLCNFFIYCTLSAASSLHCSFIINKSVYDYVPNMFYNNFCSVLFKLCTCITVTYFSGLFFFYFKCCY